MQYFLLKVFGGKKEIMQDIVTIIFTICSQNLIIHTVSKTWKYKLNFTFKVKISVAFKIISQKVDSIPNAYCVTYKNV